MSMRILDNTIMYHRFSLSKVIRTLMRIPDNNITYHCFAFYQCDSNVDENT